MSGRRVLPLVLGLAAVLGACRTDDGDDDGNGNTVSPGWGEGSGGGGGATDGWCEMDSDCAGTGSADVCARDGECLPSSQIWTIHVNWTIAGQPASATTCTSDFELSFLVNDPSQPYGPEFGFAPVPCAEGRFTIDKMPTDYEYVILSDDQTYVTGMFDGSGNVTLDFTE